MLMIGSCRKLFNLKECLCRPHQIEKRKENEVALANQPRPEKQDKPVKEKRADLGLTITAATTEEEIDALIDEKIKSAPRLEETDCLFCNETSATFEDNMSHMTMSHSFFIPDIEYLVDMHGLIKYLGEKISVGNVCLYCNEKGRSFRSLEAVRTHMVRYIHFFIHALDSSYVDFFW